MWGASNLPVNRNYVGGDGRGPWLFRPLRRDSTRRITMMTMTRASESTVPSLLLAFELGQRVWKLGFVVGVGQRPRIRHIAAGAVDRVAEEIARAKVRLKLPADAPVISCFEAGRDG